MNSGLIELKRRFMFLIFSLLVFRFGSFIPIPGINTVELSELINKQQGTIVELFNMFSGGALSRVSIFSLGIMPYISASIIIELLTLIHPTLKELKKEGDIGRSKINLYIRYMTLLLAIIQSVGLASSVFKFSNISNLIIVSGVSFYFYSVLSLVTGTMFLMWLSELITYQGIGNGVSIIISSGILVGFPSSIANTFESFRKGNLSFILVFLMLLIVFLITFLVVFIERSQRKILVQYSRKQQGKKIYSSHTTHLPLKVNISGVMPAIFASSIMLFPATIVAWCGRIQVLYWVKKLSLYFYPYHIFYLLIYISLIIFFCFFYTELIFNPRETAENLKKSGAFIPGIRPGEQTAKFIQNIMSRLTVIGSLYISCICLVPELLRYFINVPFYFGGTSLLIVVVVIIDFIVQVQTIIMSNKYDSILKKSNISFKK